MWLDVATKVQIANYTLTAGDTFVALSAGPGGTTYAPRGSDASILLFDTPSVPTSGSSKRAALRTFIQRVAAVLS